MSVGRKGERKGGRNREGRVGVEKRREGQRRNRGEEKEERGTEKRERGRERELSLIHI